MSRLYVFALTSGVMPAFEDAGRVVEFVRAGAVHAAIERRDSAPSATEASLRQQHAIVARIAGEVESVLPARFGMLLEAGELEAAVARREPAIVEALALVRGRRQMTVRLRHGALAGRATPDGAAAQPAPLSHGEPGRVPQSGTDYLEARRAAAALPAALREVCLAVRHLVEAEVHGPARGAIPPAVYHLIDRRDDARYRAAVDRVRPGGGGGGQSAGGGSEILVTGPWPPFAFTPDVWS